MKENSYRLMMLTPTAKWRIILEFESARVNEVKDAAQAFARILGSKSAFRLIYKNSNGLMVQADYIAGGPLATWRS